MNTPYNIDVLKNAVEIPAIPAMGSTTGISGDAYCEHVTLGNLETKLCYVP